VQTESLVIVTPIWRSKLDALETAFAHVTDESNERWPRVFVAPRGLDVTWYHREFPDREVRGIEDRHLSDVESYSAWMTTPEPYEMFMHATVMAVCQSDAVLVRGLEPQGLAGVDFVGAPWEPALRSLKWGRRLVLYSPTGGGPLISRMFGRRLRVGNGGLSMRRTASFFRVSALLQETVPEHFARRIHEDAYFAALGPAFGLKIADAESAGALFCESGARTLTDTASYTGFHGLEKWNFELALRIAESVSGGSVS
jgi:hypothetical protein